MTFTARAAVLAALLTLFGTTTAVATERPSTARCQEHRFQVRVGTEDHTIAGDLCVRGKLTSRTPVQVLLHGGTYDRSYWDWPYQPRRYSYVDSATRVGFATLNIDRLGYGRSSRPNPETLDFAAGGEAVHQVVQRLRRGAAGPRFRTIVLNGHSMGGLVAERAAARGGIDAVIVSGIPRDRPGERSASSASPFYPAEQDPKFAGKPWAPGYLTTRPGTRAETFHHEGAYDPAIIPVEEALKDTLASAELRAVGPGSMRTRSAKTPTAYVLGEHDTLICGTSACTSQDADHVVRGSGHSLNTGLAAQGFYRWTFAWLARQGIHGR
ncbi:alpha/beta hydrolase [Amycolatopsis sp. lyj-108]|uniref:alpha/beta hydrolase n=1 Tax=Amycolatopsis sp. lyj-108 TaxID=2789286 RepID=UPI00397D1AD9